MMLLDDCGVHVSALLVSASEWWTGVDCDEVFPGIILGNGATLRKKEYLQKLGGWWDDAGVSAHCVIGVCGGIGVGRAREK